VAASSQTPHSLIPFPSLLANGTAMKTLSLWSLALFVASPSSEGRSGGESPTCDANPSLCAGSVRRNAKANDAASVVPCELYMAESVVHPGQWGVYSGIAVRKGEKVGQTEPVIPMVDAKMNEWSPWNGLVEPSPPRLRLESKFLNSIFTPGIQQLVSCSNRYHNVLPVVHDEVTTSTLLHRRQDAGAGSVAQYEASIVATRDLLAGEELVVSCDSLTRFANPRGDDSDSEDAEPDFPQDSRRFVLSVEHLSDSESSNAICLDQLKLAPSSVLGAGRGAFAKRDIGVGHVIIPTPVLHLDWSQMEIVKQSLYSEETVDIEDGESAKPYQPFLPIQREHGIKYSGQVVGQQLMLNFAYGSPESHVLLVPTGPTVNSINHNSDPARVNAYLRWSHRHSSKSMPQLRPMELLSRASAITYHDRSEGEDSDSTTLMIEIVALRDIAAGEEIFLDYGPDWKRSWDAHLKKVDADEQAVNVEDGYMSAAEWLAKQDSEDPWRTQEEQVSLPYPANLQTACFVSTRSIEESQDEAATYNSMEWTRDAESYHMDCLRPCSISHRIDIDGQVTYIAVVYPMDRYEEPDECGGTSIPANGLLVEDIPVTAVTLIDKPYSTDAFQPGVFRHAIGVSENFFPSSWNHADPNPAGKPIPSLSDLTLTTTRLQSC
jgi:SET domain